MTTYRTLLESMLNEKRGPYMIQTKAGNYIAKTGMMYVDVKHSSADTYESIEEAEALFDTIVKSFQGMSVSDLTVVST